MANVFSTLIVGFSFLSAGEALSRPVNCTDGTDAIPGITCDTRCPTPAAGMRLLDSTCRCKKNKTKTDCIASGKCKEYTLAGVPTGVEKDCECERNTTHSAAEIEETELDATSGLQQ